MQGFCRSMLLFLIIVCWSTGGVRGQAQTSEQTVHGSQKEDDDWLIEAPPEKMLKSLGPRHDLTRLLKWDGPEARDRGVYTSLYVWPPMTKQLNVCFFNGSPEQRARVVKTAKAWNDVGSRIELIFNTAKDCSGTSADEHIRVAFKPDGTIWSLLGQQSVKEPGQFPPSEPSMNLGFDPDDQTEKVERAILHEFGHALGLEHEHQHPDVRCWPHQFKSRLLKQHLRDKGWDADRINANMTYLERGGTLFRETTPFDRNAVMLYRFPARYYKDGVNSICYADEIARISKDEQQLMQMLYPPDDKKAAELAEKRVAYFGELVSSLAKMPTVKDAFGEDPAGLVSSYLTSVGD